MSVITSAPARLPDGSTVQPGGPVQPPDAATGDGTTAASRARARWRRWRGPVTALVVLLATAVLASVIRPSVSAIPLAPDNPQPSGARAVAQILQRQGVRIQVVHTAAAAQAAAGPESTLLVTRTFSLLEEDVAALERTPADLVLVDPDGWVLRRLAPGLTPAASPGSSVASAKCPDPDAQEAEQVESRGTGFTTDDRTDPAATICFPDTAGAGAYAVVDGERRVTAFDDALFTNERLADHGHAALALRALGRHEHLVWYIPAPVGLGGDPNPFAGPSFTELLPPWATLAGLQLLLAVAAAAVWRGRRLGRLVTEPLPVTVRSAEATVGRGRLYRAARSYGHAAAGLRAGTAARAAARLGLPRSAPAPHVIDAVAAATGRPAQEVAALLYGPPPTDDAGLLALARQLDELESEVHRP